MAHLGIKLGIPRRGKAGGVGTPPPPGGSLPVTAGLVAYYKAEDIVDTGGGETNLWPDSGPNGDDLDMVAPVAPGFIANWRNGLPAIDCTAGALKRGPFTAPLASPTTIFSVGEVPNGAPYNQYDGGGVGDGDPGRVTHFGDGVGGLFFNAGVSRNSTEPSNNPSPRVTGFIASNDPAVCSYFVQQTGASPIGRTGTSVGTSALTAGVRVGCAFNESAFAGGPIAEWILYDRALSPSEVNQVLAFLVNKFGVQPSAQYI